MNTLKKIYINMNTEYIKDKYTKDDIFNAKIYMMEYKFLDEIHKLNAGIIGRFFEKIFGTSAYADIEECLKNKYNLPLITTLCGST